MDDGEQYPQPMGRHLPGDAWYPVVASGALGPGEVTGAVVPDRSAGDACPPGTDGSASDGERVREVAVWRDADGRPCVVDARCPHQWSHLAAEGFVDGDELVCTAHFWRFDRNGRGCKLAMSGRRDPKADVEVLACEESDGHIWVDI